MYSDKNKIKELVGQAQHIIVIQADNPDGDSLGSALALEEILGDLGKEVYLYCGVDIPDYLKHLKGWDRVSNDLPPLFDLSFIVDTSAVVLLEKLEHSSQRAQVARRPVVVLDHHAGVKCDIPYATIVINDDAAVATGEVVYKLAEQLQWSLNLQAKTHVTSSILADSLGLSSAGTTPQTYRIMADLIEAGVDRPALEEARRALTKMPEEIFRYKASLISRVELYAEGKVALVDIPHDEIMRYSPLYNPAPLIQTDMLQTENVLVAIVLKHYKDGKILGSIRTNAGAEIASQLATYFGGGGHGFAAGFKVQDGREFNQVKSECIKKASQLLSELDEDATG